MVVEGDTSNHLFKRHMYLKSNPWQFFNPVVLVQLVVICDFDFLCLEE